MNGSEFVDVMKRRLREATINTVLSQLTKPSGRQPHERRLRQSRAYLNLSEADREFVATIVRETAHVALFSLCAILDGSRVVDTHSRFELYSVAGDVRHLINGPRDQQLMDFVGIDPTA